MESYILRNIEDPAMADIGGYERTGGYGCLRKALSMKPGEVIEEVRKSGLQGRGGAGFPVAKKWSFAASDPKRPKYLICNGDEGEPGTFKDRPILERKPHMLLEGMAIAAHAIGAGQGYIYLRGEYPKALEVLNEAIRQAYGRGYLGEDIMGSGVSFHLSVHRGAGAYICGEETALIESLEGKRGNPRLRPPFPVNAGYLSKPTVVNNVETLCNIPLIMEMGGEAYSGIGKRGSPGPKIYAVSGHVERPGVYELPMGIPLREIIYEHAGGIRGGRALKAVIPGGLSTPVLTPGEIDCSMDFVSMPACGSMLGSGAVIAFDETTCLVRVCLRAMRFFEHESCGKCTPCREGTGWLRAVLERIEHGKGRPGDIDLLLDVAGNMAGTCFCPLGEGAAMVLSTFIRKFGEEFMGHIESSGCGAQG